MVVVLAALNSEGLLAAAPNKEVLAGCCCVPNNPPVAVLAGVEPKLPGKKGSRDEQSLNGGRDNCLVVIAVLYLLVRREGGS